MVHHPAHPTPPQLRHWTLPELIWAREWLLEEHERRAREAAVDSALARLR